VDLAHLLDEFDSRTLSVLLVKLSIGNDMFVGELSNSLLKGTMTVLVVR